MSQINSGIGGGFVVELLELRRLADETIQRAAIKIGCSYGHLWNAEQGRATLTRAQVTLLQRYYFKRIKKRVGRFGTFLPAAAKQERTNAEIPVLESK